MTSDSTDIAASEVYVVEVRRTPRWLRAARWAMVAVHGIWGDPAHPSGFWREEAVIRDLRSRRRLAVVRNGSGSTSDLVAAAVEDVDELDARAFAQLYL